MVSIVIVDDHPMVREGLEAMLMSESGFNVAGTAANGKDGFQLVLNTRPDVVLSDIRMPGTDGFALLESLRIAAPRTRVLLLAGMPLKDEEERARAGGAAGYLPKDVDLDRLSAAIRQAAADRTSFACETYESAPSPLTGRETDVLKLLAEGLQREAIAARLGIGPESVKTHLKGIMNKLGCHNATSAVGKAYSLGILRA